MATEDPVARKRSMASVSDDVSVDRSNAVTSDFSPGSDDFTSPIDEILCLIQHTYDKRLKLSSKDMQVIDSKAHEMKNRIINFLLPSALDKTKKVKPSPLFQDTVSPCVWPSLTSNKSRSTSTLLIKSDPSKKFESSDASLIESKVNSLISKEQMSATISSSSSTKNGDVVIRFDQNDDVKAIEHKVQNEFGYQTRSRSLPLPKLTISHVPKYVAIEKESVAELIMKSNPWLENFVRDGETFEVLFTYEVRDWRSIVLKASPKIRSEIIFLGSTLRIENRRCPVKDRFHIQQCGKCLGFGHKSHMCLKEQLCAHCNGEHRISDCPEKSDNAKLLCSNCHKSSDDGSWCTNHSAFSKSCPMYLKRMRRQAELTHWGNGPFPNI